MSTSTIPGVPPPLASSSKSKYTALRIACWGVALTLGAVQAWATRFTMNPDGISYLDLGDAFWHGDWHNAINAYWSPLYPILLGLFIKLLKPSPYWEYPAVHLLSFLTYAMTLGCFEFLISTLIRERKYPQQDPTVPGKRIPEYAFRLFGYTVFISCSLLMIGLGLVAPDMSVAALVYLASGLTLRIRNGAGTWAYAVLGVVLGAGYLSKTVMLPLAFLFLAAIFYKNVAKDSLKNCAIAVLVFAWIVVPLITALSFKEHHLTFGEVGPIAYEVYVDRINQFIPDQNGVAHPVPKILDSPPLFEFTHPIAGTYPLWYDPTYWHAGIKPHFDLRGQLQAIGLASLLYLWIPTTYQLNLTVPLLMFLLIAKYPWVCLKRAAAMLPLTIPGLGALLLYSLVYAESRYLAPFFALLWLAVFSGLLFDSADSWILITALMLAMFAAQFVILARMAPKNNGPIYFQAAEQLRTLGVSPGNTLAVFAHEPFGETAFAARLLRARIVIQSVDVEGGWINNADTSTAVLTSLRRHGVSAALWYGKPPLDSKISWQRLNGTHYYVHVLETGR